ncbi:response regulator [Dyella koreensis]|uniref:Response regulator n=1 Tax=Dyella koreensis TaxID=311235 RepID=A0ABW8K2R9_9GAMM
MRLPDLEHDHCDILLVEDNPKDVRLTREALRESGFDCELSVARNGMEALDMLRRVPPFEHLPAPDLILLDINLPLKSGRDVLAEIKQDDRLRSIPVIMLTTSRAESDVKACYDLHANCYLAKPLEFDDFTELMRGLHNFWIDRALLPPKPML